MTNVEGRTIQLELAVKALQAQLAAALTRLAAAEQLGRSAQGITYNWGGGGGGSNNGFWVMAPFGGMGASSGTFPDIVPTRRDLTVYQSVGGVFTTLGVRTCNWWYRDALPQYRLVPVVQCSDGTYDMLANSCTPVNP